jgi:hypothetical protein
MQKDSGLSPKDIQDLHDVMQNGDQFGISTKLWTLQQRSPMFKKRYEEALMRANGDQE